jgi:hypothetical protein
MALKGVDIAWSRPTTAQIKAVGAHFVARYLSPDSSKNITKAEVQDYKANGLSVVVVWESSANRMLGGRAAGAADAKAAEIQRAAVGLPSDQVIYFACDFDAQGTQYHTINEYLRGVASVIGLNRVGIYGGYYVVENVFSAPATARYGWQTIAWSGGKWSSHANIRQEGGTTLSGGADWDTAETADYGQYPRPQAPKPAPAPAPAPTPKGGSVDPTQVWSYKNGQTKDAYAMLVGVYEAVADKTIASQVDGVRHSLGEHTAATNAVAIKGYADIEQLKKDVAELKVLLAAIAKKVGV